MYGRQLRQWKKKIMSTKWLDRDYLDLIIIFASVLEGEGCISSSLVEVVST